MSDADSIAGLIRRELRAFAADRNAATAIEYGLIVALIGLVISVAITGTGDSVASGWQLVADKIGETLKATPGQ